MAEPLERGQRIARARRRRGLSQSALAGLVGRSESWLSQVERGLRPVDSHRILRSLAGTLHVDVAELTGDEQAEQQTPRYKAADRIERAMMAYDGLESVISGAQADRTPVIDRLVLALERVNRTYQAARYEEAGWILPALIRSVETAFRTCPRRDAITVSRIRSEVYQAATMVLSRVGNTGLAWTAADRAVTAAEHADAAILTAMSAYRLAHVFTRREQPRQARDLAASAASALTGTGDHHDPERLSVVGSLQLADALAAATEFDRQAASRALEQAEQTADRLGQDRNDHWTAFGPTNVHIHRISAAVAFGDAGTAVEAGERLNLQRLPTGLAGRRSQVSLDLARAYAQQRYDAAAVNMLLEAERSAPQLVRYDTATHDLLMLLLRREHRASTPQLRPLAHRAGAI
ncbi:MAG: helix-turn-helix transcriptional regulator [Actinobacteria bacterium]|nr:helix-turn-helix transcriptional regulator [Actinomycetota bacterium]